MSNSNRRRQLKEARASQGLCVYCGDVPPAQDKRGCVSCLEKKHETQKKYLNANQDAQQIYVKQVRKNVIDKYGGKCACLGCEEDRWEFLVIDHINNDGGEERKELFGSQSGAGSTFLKMLNAEPRREDLQVLCWNCNAGKAQFGECPHIRRYDTSQFSEDWRNASHLNKTGYVDWPSDLELAKRLTQTNCATLAKELNVHDTALRGHLKRRGLYDIVRNYAKKYEFIEQKVGPDNIGYVSSKVSQYPMPFHEAIDFILQYYANHGSPHMPNVNIRVMPDRDRWTMLRKDWKVDSNSSNVLFFKAECEGSLKLKYDGTAIYHICVDGVDVGLHIVEKL